LLVQGRLDRLAELQGRRHLVVEDSHRAAQVLTSTELGVAEVRLSPDSSLAGQTLHQCDFRRHFGVNVLALWRGGSPRQTHLQDTPLQPSDALFVQGPHARLEAMRNIPDFDFVRPLPAAEVVETYHLHERLVVLHIPEDSIFAGRTLAESRLGDAFGLTALGIVRQDDVYLMPDPQELLKAEDSLLVQGDPEDLLTLRGLQDLQVEPQATPDFSMLESEHVGLVEVVLSPHTTLAGKTLRQLHFREKYGLSVLAIWREGRAYRSNLRDMALHFGDALLLYGPREKLKLLGSEPDFLVLTEAAQEVPRLDKTPLATLVMVAVLLPVILGWLPISITAVVGGTLMVLTGCLTMEEAYRFIEWRAVFLIAGMLPLGMAMETTGTARFLADLIVSVIGSLGPLAILAGIYVLAGLITEPMSNAAATVLMVPIAIDIALGLGADPRSFVLATVVGASTSFLTPVGHQANVLVFGPGGYRFFDYTRVGGLLNVAILIATLIFLPIIWPLFR